MFQEGGALRADDPAGFDLLAKRIGGERNPHKECGEDNGVTGASVGSPHQIPSSFSAQRRTVSVLRKSSAMCSACASFSRSATTVATATSHLSLKPMAIAVSGAAYFMVTK